MSRFQITRRRLLFALGVIIGLVVIIPSCIYLFSVLMFTISTTNGGFKFIPQDCNGVPITIAGKVQSANHEPIKGATIQVKYSAMDNSSQFSYTLQTDGNGLFTYEKSLSIFVCEDVNFTVSANGFKNKSVQYSLFSDHSENEILTTKVNKINITITLERSS